jgi:hypothetical protein
VQIAQVLLDSIKQLGTVQRDSEGLGQSVHDLRGVMNGSQIDETDAVDKVGRKRVRDLDCEPRLADSRRPEQGKQSHGWCVQELLHMHNVLCPAN